MARTVWHFAAAAALLVLLAVLATLQYRWLGEVSNAERERLRTSLRTRAAQFTDEFDREITRVYTAFEADAAAVDRDAAAVLADGYARAQAGSPVGGVVRAVYLLDASGARAGQLQQLDPGARTLTPVTWPSALEAWRARTERAGTGPGLLSRAFIAEAVDEKTPALVVPIPTLKRFETGAKIAMIPDPAGPARMVLVWLDADRVRRQLVELLLAKHFGTGDASEYCVSVVSRREPAETIFASNAGAAVTLQNADLATAMFDVRLDELNRFGVHLPATPPDGRGKVTDRFAITIVRRADGGGGAHVLTAGGRDGAWQVLFRFKTGSLEALVAQSRRRNLAISLGVLGLLAVSFVFVVASAQRQQRLARQQMEFVAAVSHELRTPLAVIRSAGENLADGVVGDADQVKRYGSLIRTEGRRLSDMVERVMEFAGIGSGAAMHMRGDVDAVRLLDEAMAAASADAHERGVTIARRIDGPLPSIAGDADALRSAIQNVVGNAIKYSASGSVVEVQAARDDGRVRLTVADRGIGIDERDLPHIFKPFYRGRRAVDAQIRGTGVGLSVVRYVVEAHDGEVRVSSEPARGTTVTILLPAARDAEAVATEARAET